MSWLLFLDESGHDHRHLPYEVRGGVAFHAAELWPFVQAVQRLETDSFGCHLHEFGKELKGSTLLDRKRYRFAKQAPAMDPPARRKHCRNFLAIGLQKKKGLQPRECRRPEFTAYGQACLEMARGMFQLLRDHKAVLFASAIPRRVQKPDTFEAAEFLRKDHVFLFERYFYFLESKREHGLIVMDEAEKHEDRRFVRRLQSYFRKTQTGRYRTAWIVPTPLFVASDMTYAVQAADLCIYCLNWGFRLPSQGMNAESRREIAEEFGPWLNRLQFRGKAHREGEVFETYGITFVPDPYSPR